MKYFLDTPGDLEMRKGYTESPPRSHDDEGKPISGAPPLANKSSEKRQSKRDRDRQERFRLNADKPVNWTQNLRTANGPNGGHGFILMESLYRGFAKRLAEDEIFQNTVIERAMDRIMAELFVPVDIAPNIGAKLSIVRKDKV